MKGRRRDKGKHPRWEYGRFYESTIISGEPKEGRKGGHNQESSGLMIFLARFALKFSSEHTDTPIISLKHYPKTF